MPALDTTAAASSAQRALEALDASARLSALVVSPLAREMQPVAGGPRLSSSSGALLREIEVTDEYGDHRSVQIPVERALAVFLDGRQVGQLWTLGAQPDWLVVGYLRSRRLIEDVKQVDSVSIEWGEGTASVFTRRAYPIDSRLIAAGAQAEPRALSERARLSRTTLHAVLETMRGNDAIYRAAGSVQACALFRGPDLLLSVEDVSRRNSYDTISGWMALHGVPGHDKILFTTGRLTAEVVMKTAGNGVPVIVARKGITSACFDLATRLGMTLIGHAAQRRYICYAGADRFDADA